MNWVGGVRNRLKTKDEKRRQKEFFEKMKYGSKVGRLKRTNNSPRNTSLPTSLDLLSLQAADYSAKKFRQSDPEQKPKIKVKKIEMDRSRGMFPYSHYHQELPMSPDETPSKLQLQEPDNESPLLSYPAYEGHLQTANSFYNINQSSEMLKKSTPYTMKPEESDSHHEFVQSSCPFHSTPIIEVDDAPHQPLKHQGKHFEDLFFSFIPPGCDNENVSSGSKELLPSASNDGTSDDWKHVDGFEYSPLSFIPSESSQSDTASSSQITISQDSQQEDPRNTCQSGTMKMQCNNTDTLTIDDDIASNVSNIEDDEIPRMTSITQKRNPNSQSNSEKVDLICKETDDFLSPSNKHQESKSTSGKTRKTGIQQGLDVLRNSQDVGVINLTSEETEEEQTTEQNPVKSCPTQSLTNSFKWKAFVSGQNFSENPTILNKERKVNQLPTKTMSSVCQQVLQEVMQLDRELIQKSPYLLSSTSKSGSLTSMMGFTAIPATNPKMEEFSLTHAKGTEVANLQTGDKEPDNKHRMQYGEQQVPDRTDQHITSKSLQIHSSLSDSSEQQDTDDEEDSDDEDNSTVQLQDCNQHSQENKESQRASDIRSLASCLEQSGLRKSSPEPTDNDCPEMASCQDAVCCTHTDTSTLITCNSVIQNKATQCDVNTVTTEDKETQYKLIDCSESLCVENEASAIQENNINTSDPSFPGDPYDGCKIC